jgi:hypothetical protein
MQKLDMKTVAVGIKSEFEWNKLCLAAFLFLDIGSAFKNKNINIHGKTRSLYYSILVVQINTSLCQTAKK